MIKGISKDKYQIWQFETYSDCVAAKDEFGNILIYQDLAKATLILQDAIGSRNLVFLVCSNTLDSLIGYTACMNSGNVPIMLSGDLDDEQIDELYKIYHPNYMYAPVERENLAFVDSTILKLCNCNRYRLYKTMNANPIKMHSDLALLLTTSGSTGSPKLVRQTYNNIKANTASIVEYLELDMNERPITTLPMNYTYGLSIINSHLAVGATIYVSDRSLMQREFWNFFKSECITSFGGVPYTFEILKKLRIFRMDLPSLQTMTQAGGKMTPELHKEFAEYAKNTGKRFVVMYGQTEATARMAYLPAEKSLEKVGSMGIAIPGGRFWLVDINGNVIHEENVVGELIYEGENVTMGYAECVSDLEKEDENQGILHTGDMAKMDSDGYYYIVGRKKRFLKIYGKRVNLDEVGIAVKVQFTDVDCVASGKDDSLYVFITDKRKVEDVKCYVREKLHINANALHVVAIDNIPKNEFGKVQFTKLEQYYV